MSRYRPNSRSFVGKSTADCCLALWHRVGGRMFPWNEVKDLLASPSQLTGMVNRGYVVEVGRVFGKCPNYQPKLWQLTDHARALADTREGAFA
jgi:hypothetical protein